MIIFNIYRLSKKLKCTKSAYKVLKLVYRPKTPKDIIRKDYLNDIYPDNGSSCICKNKISKNPKYDLQIIIPVYNVEKYLKDCLESILKQRTSYKYQIVCINDGSTDNCLNILGEYKTRPNFTIIDQSNQGLSASRNTALKQIDSKYVMFVDSDDRLFPDAIENLLKTAFQIDADIVEGGASTLF